MDVEEGKEEGNGSIAKMDTDKGSKRGGTSKSGARLPMGCNCTYSDSEYQYAGVSTVSANYSKFKKGAAREER